MKSSITVVTAFVCLSHVGDSLLLMSTLHVLCKAHYYKQAHICIYIYNYIITVEKLRSCDEWV